jgi:hypothetical protein
MVVHLPFHTGADDRMIAHHYKVQGDHLSEVIGRALSCALQYERKE